MLVILVQNVHQTVMVLDAMMTFIVTPANMDSLVISVTKPAQNIVKQSNVTRTMVLVSVK